MSMEQNEMQGSQGQQAPPAVTIASTQEGSPTGPQNSQRRRRRRRKASKGAAPQSSVAPASQSVFTATTDEVESVPAPAVSQAEAPPQRSARTGGRDSFAQDGTREQQPPQPRQAQQPGQGGKKQHKGKNGSNGGGANGNGSGQGRQFHKGAYSQQQAPSNREYNPGNGSSSSNNGGGMAAGAGARRKQKGRRSAPTFVGPMDHSYRAVNGNVADGSPSTMDFRSNANGNGYSRASYSEFVEAPAPVSPRSDGPTRILCFIEELFVVARMQEHARKLGVKVGFCKAEKETLATLMDLPEAERPSLIIFDLNNANAKPLTLIPKLKAKLKRSTSIIGYLSHIQGDLKLKAIEAGCDTVMPKSAFSQNLPNLLRRHGLEEEVEAVEV